MWGNGQCAIGAVEAGKAGKDNHMSIVREPIGSPGAGRPMQEADRVQVHSVCAAECRYSLIVLQEYVRNQDSIDTICSMIRTNKLRAALMWNQSDLEELQIMSPDCAMRCAFDIDCESVDTATGVNDYISRLQGSLLSYIMPCISTASAATVVHGADCPSQLLLCSNLVVDSVVD